ncbi:Enoyl-[acyl-carrier-protein] reductase [Durusdinium trenchii]|uniref:Mitochondrial (2-enoyl thioester reductase) n=1 Tax=Durusdinium trenchii TaxID=1381693 RepID=A0ABP0M8X8_9DINO
MVSPNRTLYDILGVAKDASVSGIRAAYRKLAVQLHPDKGGDPEAFAEMQAAYQILCSVTLRQRYDETGKTDVPEDVRKARRSYYEDSAHVPTPPKEEQQQRCWKCNAELSPAAKFCQECGAPREAPSKPKETTQKDVKVQLPPALQAMMEGRTLESLPVPEEYEQAVAHITVTEKEGKRTLRLVDTYPFIDNSRLIEGQVLVQIRAVPLTMSDLNAENRYSCGDIYGSQGIGQVRMVGPRVKNLQPGDWVLPLHDVDADGEVDLDALPPGTGRVLGVWKADRCAKLEFSADSPLTIANMALAKSIGAACLLMKEHTLKLSAGDAVILNCANGLIGQVLIQLLAAKGFQVYAVVRKHTGEEWIKQKLQGLGASHVFLTSDDIRSIIEEMGQPLPQLALDGVGGTATNQLVQTLSKTADLVCFGVAGGSSQQAVTFATGKKWKGSLLQFSFDEWLNRDVSANAKILNDMLLDVTELVKQKRMQFVIKEYTTERFNMAVLNAKQIGRTHAVVLHLPRLEENPTRYTTEGDALALPERSLEKDYLSRHNRSWDLDFLQWEDVNADEEVEWRLEKERSLFRLHPQSQKDQKNVEGVLQLSQGVSSTPTAIAQELGCSPEKAEAVLFWLPGRGEIPQEHAHWLERICVSNRELRVIILEPHQLEEDLKWYEMSDNDAVQLGLRFSIVDDDIKNPCGDLSRSKGVASFGVPLLPSEIDAVQQVEGAALGLKRRAQLEEKQLKTTSRSSTLPFFFGGFGQGGVVALYAALCLMDKPIDAVAFCHSGIPAASMLGKRLSQQVRTHTRLHAIYDKADQEIPISFPETIHQMFSLARCKVSLYWLQNGDGHQFLDEASDTVRQCAHMWLDERQKLPDFLK